MAEMCAYPAHETRVEANPEWIRQQNVIACNVCFKYHWRPINPYVTVLCPHCACLCPPVLPQGAGAHGVTTEDSSSGEENSSAAPLVTGTVDNDSGCNTTDRQVPWQLHLVSARSTAAVQLWRAIRDGPFFHPLMSRDVLGMFFHGGIDDDAVVTEAALKQRQYVVPTLGRIWLRIPNSSLGGYPVAERHSTYGSTTTCELIVGYHRVKWDKFIQVRCSEVD